MNDLSSSKLSRNVREAKLVAKGLTSTKHPILAHVIPMRRCNLACGYCNEYDKVSEPVPLEEMKRRLDKLGSFGTTTITISGAAPANFRNHCAHPLARNDRGTYQQRLLHDPRKHREAQLRRPRIPADQH
jgi:2-iminoacetate synthase ThiH